MGSPVVIDAIRTPIGRRGGALSSVSAPKLLRSVLIELLGRNDVQASTVGHIIGGCVTQVGEQALNVTRNAWLSTGLDYEVPSTTVDVSCGSSQQANHLIAALIASDVIDCGIACGVEAMSRVPIGANIAGGEWKTDDYPWDDPPRLQFGGAERIAQREGFTREDLEEYAVLSQERAANAWAERRFDGEVVSITVPGAGCVSRDEGLRATTRHGLASLPPVMRGGLHTAGTSSQVSDGAAAVLWMSEDRARSVGAQPRARIVHQLVTGADPYYLLDGPTVATQKILERARLSVADIDVFEVNEAFASVVLSWLRHHKADPDRVNVNGGAIALGHPMGATGARLIATALAELERQDGELALVTMCCGGSLGTASLVERVN
jgi:acetyl-CoA C-acetyltransferase